MVTTSFSVAPLQMGRDWERQKARLHWLQEGLVVWARRALDWKRFWGDCGRSVSGVMSEGWAAVASLEVSGVAWLSPSSEEDGTSGAVDGVEDGEGVSVSSSLVGGSSLRWEDEPVDDLDLISMMVLLLKHVHLQNVGAAGWRECIPLVSGGS